MLSQCKSPQVVSFIEEKPKKPFTSRGKNAWICYLKYCAKTTGLTYLDCVKDKVRAKQEYYPKKEHWHQEALKGC